VAVTIAAIVAFGVHWLPIYFPQGPPSTGEKSFRLLSTNLQFDNANLDRFFRLVEEEKPDLILIFELSSKWAPTLQHLRTGYPYFLAQPSPGHSGCGVYSRLPLEQLAIEPLGPYPNFVAVMRVRIDNSLVHVFGTHPLAPYSPREMRARNAQLTALAERVGNERSHRVIAGDLNTSGWSPCFKQLMRATNTRDTRCGFGIGATFPSAFWPMRIPIDHCLVSSDIAVVDRRVGPNIGSDHLPIVIDLQIRRSPE
jgi:endonuclease/exonuclease/phosphatase (EEP) superfamily protein YafD